MAPAAPRKEERDARVQPAHVRVLRYAGVAAKERARSPSDADADLPAVLRGLVSRRAAVRRLSAPGRRDAACRRVHRTRGLRTPGVWRGSAHVHARPRDRREPTGELRACIRNDRLSATSACLDRKRALTTAGPYG